MTRRPAQGPARSRRTTWRPSRAQWVVFAGAVVGSAFGLLFGLTSVNRPLANAAVFYLLGGLAGAALAAVAVLVVRVAGRRGRRQSPRG